MFRLRVLGQVDLRDPDGREVMAVLVQPKRLALLAYLVAFRPQRMHRRDALLPLFWPDIPESRARSSLRQALHQLRQALGPHVLTTRGADCVGVNAAALECDAAEFENALDRGRLADAVLAYGGDLLPAFSIDGSAAFNEWLDETRLRLRNRAARAGWALAEQQERSGDIAAAAASARRAAELLVEDERGLRQLMSLLERTGDPTGAIRAYEDFAARLRRDLDLEPSPETRALHDSVRAGSRSAAGSATDTTRPMARAVVAPDGSTAGASPRSSARPTVVVSSFDNLTGSPELDFVGRLAATAVSQAVAETRLVDVLAVDDDVHDRSSGAHGVSRLVIEGSYHIVDDAWHMQSTLQLARDAGSRGIQIPGISDDFRPAATVVRDRSENVHVEPFAGRRWPVCRRTRRPAAWKLQNDPRNHLAEGLACVKANRVHEQLGFADLSLHRVGDTGPGHDAERPAGAGSDARAAAGVGRSREGDCRGGRPVAGSPAHGIHALPHGRAIDPRGQPGAGPQ